MAFSIKKQANLKFKKNTTFKIPRTFLPSSLGGLSLWLKADAGVTLGTYVSQIILTCTGSLSSYSGTYIATSAPDTYGVYSLFCSANSKTILKDGFNSAFTIGPDFPLASSGNGISWSLNNVLVAGLTISGATGSNTGANGVYLLNERTQSSGDIFRNNENGYYGLVNTNGAVDIYSPDFVLIYSNSSFGSGAWTNVGGTGTVTASSIQLDPSGTVSGSITTSPSLSVTAWADQSSYNQDLFFPAEDDAVAPVLVTIKGKNFVSFQSSSPLERVTEVFGPIIGTAFFVARFPTTGNSPTTSYLFTYGFNGPFRIGRGVNATKAFFLGSVISNTNLNDDTTYLIGTTFNNPAVSLYLNAASVGSGNFSTSSSEYYRFFIGGNNFVLDGAIIAEVIMYGSVLTTPERQQVEAYLNQKYVIY
jgi:hypothetical protein